MTLTHLVLCCNGPIRIWFFIVAHVYMENKLFCKLKKMRFANNISHANYVVVVMITHNVGIYIGQRLMIIHPIRDILYMMEMVHHYVVSYPWRSIVCCHGLLFFGLHMHSEQSLKLMYLLAWRARFSDGACTFRRVSTYLFLQSMIVEAIIMAIHKLDECRIQVLL